MPLWHHWAFRYIQDGVQDGDFKWKNVCYGIMSQTHSLFLIVSYELESSWRHLACNQIKYKIKMRPRWLQRLKFITQNIRKSSLGPTNSRDLHAKCLFYWFFNYRHHPCNIPVILFMHHSDFDKHVFNMASRLVSTKFYKPVGVAPYL